MDRMSSFSQMATNIVAAIIILVVAVWIGALVKRLVIRALKNRDVTLATFVGSICRYTVLAVAVIIILDRFGVQTASLMVLLGSAGLAIGLALQGTLSSVAAGVMLMIFRPFKIGDYVDVAGHAGTVVGVTLFTTELSTPDNVQITMPNANVWGQAIVNYSAHDTRRVDLVFGVSYDTDMTKAEKAIKSVLGKEKRINAEPEPAIMVSMLNDSSVDFTVRVWCNSGDYWGVKFDLTRAVKAEFDKQSIDIPFPTRTIVQAS